MSTAAATSETPSASRLRLWPLGIPWILSGILLAYATRWGPWVLSDSVEFIAAARNVLSGGGLGIPAASGRLMALSLHPPLYPLLLSAVGLAEQDLTAAARWLNVTLLVGTVLVVSLGSYRLTRSLALGVGVGLLTATSPLLLALFSGALSEAPFVLLCVLALSLLTVYWIRPGKVGLALVTLFSGLAALTRYAGVAVIASCVIVICVAGARPLRRRLVEAIGVLVVASAPLAVWLVSLRRMGAAARQWSPVPLADLWDALEPLRGAMTDSILNWLGLEAVLPEIPYRQKLVVIAAVGAFVTVVLALWARKNLATVIQGTVGSNVLRLAVVLGVFLLVYGMTLAGSIALWQPTPDLDARVLGPMQVAFSGMSLALAYLLLSGWSSIRFRNTAMTSAVVALVGVQSIPSIRYIVTLHRDGSGFTSQRWRESGTVEDARTLCPTIPLVSNESAALLFLLGRPAFDIPELASQRAEPAFSRFGEGDAMAERSFRDGGALVLFDNVIWQLESLYGDHAQERLDALTRGLILYSDAWDGAIYMYGTPLSDPTVCSP